jgi:hypothetical protein
MGVQFLRLDTPSRELLNKILARKAAAGAGARRVADARAARARTRIGTQRHRAAEDRHQRRPRSEFGVDEARLRRARRPELARRGKAAGEIDELEKLLKPEPVEPVSIAQALAELPRLLDPARHRRMSGAFRTVGAGGKPKSVRRSQGAQIRSPRPAIAGERVRERGLRALAELQVATDAGGRLFGVGDERRGR